jgi:hypothetical protein
MQPPAPPQTALPVFNLTIWLTDTTTKRQQIDDVMNTGVVGDVMFFVEINGTVTYYPVATVRKATLKPTGATHDPSNPYPG